MHFAEKVDYRRSHQDPAGARAYGASFTRYSYRQKVWEWEQGILTGLMREICEVKPHLRYLDFACGTGRILGLLERYAEQSCGVDVSEAMLEVARQEVHQSTLLLGDITREDLLPERSFDLITAFRFFLNAQQELRDSALRALGRILRPDGLLVLNIHMTKGCLLERALHAYQRLRKIRNPQFRPISVQETKSLLGSAHFEVIQTFHYGIIPVYRPQHHALIHQIDWIERLASKIPAFLPVSRFVIYVSRLEGARDAVDSAGWDKESGTEEGCKS